MSDYTGVVANTGSKAMSETVMRDSGMFYNNGVVAYDTGVVTNTRVVSNTRACLGGSNTGVVAFNTGEVANTEACHGDSKMPVVGYKLTLNRNWRAWI